MNQPTAIQQVLTAATGGPDYQLAPDVLFLKVWDGSARLIDLGGQTFGLPAVSATLLDVTLRHGPEEAAREASRRYSVPIEKSRADIEAFLRDLNRRGLLTRPGRGNRWWGFLRAFKTWPAAHALRFALRTIRSEHGKARALLALAYVCLRLFGWAKTVELWRRASASRPLSRHTAADSALLNQFDQTIRGALAKSVFPVDCKARALCCWGLLRWAGLPARLVVGIDLFPFLGHCWCESGDRILADRSERCDRFTPVLQYA